MVYLGMLPTVILCAELHAFTAKDEHYQSVPDAGALESDEELRAGPKAATAARELVPLVNEASEAPAADYIV